MDSSAWRKLQKSLKENLRGRDLQETREFVIYTIKIYRVFKTRITFIYTSFDSCFFDEPINFTVTFAIISVSEKATLRIHVSFYLKIINIQFNLQFNDSVVQSHFL